VSSEPLLAARSLSLGRGGRQLFEDLSFIVNAGQLLQIEGANGSGKTSLIRILAGLSHHGFEGRVERSVPLMYLGHKAAVKSMLTPRENLTWHVSGEASYSEAAIEQALERVGLYGYEDAPSHSLSAGQQRRVNLARLYLSTAPLWLLDEPFTAIDRSGVAAIEARLVAHVDSGGAVVITSHQSLSVSCSVQTLSLFSGIA